MSEPMPSAPVPLVVGDLMPTWTSPPLTRTDFVRYAGAGGDLNPIHHDETTAHAAGLPTVFGMGMLHAGILGVRLARWVGPGSIRSFGVRFTGQVWPGDRLTFEGAVVAVECGLATLDLGVRGPDGDIVLTASAKVTVAA